MLEVFVVLNLFICFLRLEVIGPPVSVGVGGYGAVIQAPRGSEAGVRLRRDWLYKSALGWSDCGGLGMVRALDFFPSQLHPLHFVSHYK